MNEQNEIVLYQPNEHLQLQVRLEHDTVWLNRNQIAQLFGRDVKTIGKHITNALREELSLPIQIVERATIAKNATVQQYPTVAKFATVQQEGLRSVVRQVEYYNLDVILSVGYRVKSSQGIAFRRWANTILKDIDKHNAQYRPIRVEKCKSVHDRFLLIDNTVYHIGASIKDLGKKLFAFSKMEMPAKDILKQIK